MYNILALLTGKQAFINGRADSEFSHKKESLAIARLKGKLKKTTGLIRQEIHSPLGWRLRDRLGAKIYQSQART
jgi:hypothetical protein